MSTNPIRFQSTGFQPTTIEDERTSRAPYGSFLVAKVTAYEANLYNKKMVVKLSGNFAFTINNNLQGNSKPVLVSMPMKLCKLPSEQCLISIGVNVTSIVAGLGGLQLGTPTPAHIIVMDNDTSPDMAFLEPVGTWYLWKVNVPQGYEPSNLPITIPAGESFTRFIRLPKELRSIVWEVYILENIDQGRHVTAQIKRTVTHKSDTIQRNNPALADKETISTWAATTLLSHEEGLRDAAMRVCKESRDMFLKMHPKTIGMASASGTKVYFNTTRDLIYISDIDLFHYYQIMKRRRAATHPIGGVENVSQLWIDATPTGVALSNRTMWLWRTIVTNYRQQKEIMEVGKGEELIGEMYQSETDKDETKLAVETTSFYAWKSKFFKKAMARLDVKVVEM